MDSHVLIGAITVGVPLLGQFFAMPRTAVLRLPRFSFLVSGRQCDQATAHRAGLINSFFAQ